MESIEKFIQEFGGVTESYWFFNHTVELRYDVKCHVYLLVKEDGTLEPQNGVTSVCHIIDKSVVLLPWGSKVMGQKLISLLPIQVVDAVEVIGTWDGSGVNPIKLTEIEKLIQQAKSAHKDKLEDAGAVGHVAHAWIEEYIKADIVADYQKVQQLLQNFPWDERASNACKAAIQWMKAHHVEWISTERKIYSKKWKYAGTMDGLCYVDSCDDPLCCPNKFKHRLTISDWKSSNYLYPEYLMQTAAYEAAYEEETGEDVEDRWVIRLGKDDAKFEAWHLESDCFQEDFDAFLAALNLKIRFDRLEERLSDIKDIYRKGKKKAKQDYKAIKCSNSDKYKGVRAPTCNKGNPCETCRKKYEDYQIAKSKKLIEKKQPKKIKLTHEQIVKNLQKLLDNVK